MTGQTSMILDVDTGVDDAMALLLALRCPRVKVLAVTCVHGNVGIDIVLANTLKVLDAAEAPLDLPVACGFAAPLVEPVTHCPEIHGQDGLGDLKPAIPASPRKARKEHAVQLLNETLRASDGGVTVMALAPLTNIAVAIRTDPELWRSKLGRLVWMGGGVAGGGNARSWSEANASYDPEAAHMVLTSGLPILMYPWDAFLKVEYPKQELLALGIPDVDEDPAGQAEAEGSCSQASQLAGRLLYRDMRHFNLDGAMIGDAGAVAAALCESEGALKTRRLHVAVELQGQHTRGMTVCDLRGFVAPPDEAKKPPNVDVVMDFDPMALKALFTRYVLLDGKSDADDPPTKKQRY